MSSKTSILAIAVAAIMVVCALSGAVMIANSNSNNNGGANDFEKKVDTTVILPVEESSDSISMQEYSALMAEAEKAKKDAAKAAADLEAQKIAAAEADAAVAKAEAELAKVREAQKIVAAEADAAVAKAEAELAKVLEDQKIAAAEADAAVAKAEAELAKVLEDQKIADEESNAAVAEAEAELAEALQKIENLEAELAETSEKLKAAQEAAAETIKSKVVLPSNMEELAVILAEPQFADVALYNALEGKYFNTADGEVLIDSVQDAANYLCGLGYFIVVDNIFAAQNISGNTSTTTETPADGDGKDDFDYKVAMSDNEKKIEELNMMIKKNPELKEEYVKQIQELVAENSKLMAEYKDFMSSNKDVTEEPAVDENDETIRKNLEEIDYLRAMMKKDSDNAAEYEARIKVLDNEISELKEKLSSTKVVDEDPVAAAPAFRSIQAITASEFVAAQWILNPSNELELMTEKIYVEDQLIQIRTSIMGCAKENMNKFLETIDKDTLMESSLVELLYGTPFIMNGEIMNVKDNATLMMYLNSTLGFDFVGTSFILYSGDGLFFVDVEDMIPLGVLRCQFVTADDGIHFSGNDYAKIAVAEYLIDGQTSKAKFLYEFGFSGEKPSDPQESEESNLASLAIDLFMGTQFYLDGKNLVVEDAESLGMYLSSLGIKVENGFVYVYDDCYSNIAYRIGEIDNNLMIDILQEKNGISSYNYDQIVKKSGDHQVNALFETKGTICLDEEMDLKLKLACE